MVRRRMLAGTFVVAGALAMAAPAWGGVAYVDVVDDGSGCPPHQFVTYHGWPGEVNQLKITIQDVVLIPPSIGGPCIAPPHAATAVISDTAGVTAGYHCTAARPTMSVCQTGGGFLGPLHIGLGDRDDTLRVAAGDEVDTGPGAGIFEAVVNAGAGNDDLTTVNGAADIVDCSDGVDTVLADPFDQLYNCENVTLKAA